MTSTGAETQLSIISPTFNRPDRAIALVKALSDQIRANHLENSVEVILVDDGSKPASVGKIRDAIRRQDDPFVRYVELPDNVGPAAARNAGVEVSHGAILAFIDDDVFPAADYVCATIRAHERNPDALVINGNLLPLRRHVYADFWFYYYNAVFNRPGQTFYSIEMLASGHCSMKRSLLDIESPLFDGFVISREDYDLFLRLKKRGIQSYKDDSVLAYNECRDTLRGFLLQRMWYTRGHERLIEKHGKTAAQALPPPHKKFWYLYVLVRLSQRAARWYAAAQRLVSR